MPHTYTNVKKILQTVLFVVIVFVAAGFLSNIVAHTAHEKFNRPDVAIFFNYFDSDVAMGIGNYYFGGGAYELDKALWSYKIATFWKHDIPQGHYQIARIYFVKGEFDKALEEINKELEFYPQNLRSLYIRGLIYGYRNMPGDREKAENDFKNFVAFAPSEWGGYNDLAWILTTLGKHEEAKIFLGQAFIRVPDALNNPWLWNSRGVADLNIGNIALAVESFTWADRLAERLDFNTWRRAYPGNSLEQAEEGLKAFRALIKENLARVEKES